MAVAVSLALAVTSSSSSCRFSSSTSRRRSRRRPCVCGSSLEPVWAIVENCRLRVSLQSSGCRAGKQFDILDYFGVLQPQSIVEFNIIEHRTKIFYIYLYVLIDDICCNLVINLQSLLSLMLMGAHAQCRSSKTGTKREPSKQPKAQRRLWYHCRGPCHPFVVPQPSKRMINDVTQELQNELDLETQGQCQMVRGESEVAVLRSERDKWREQEKRAHLAPSLHVAGHSSSFTLDCCRLLWTCEQAHFCPSCPKDTYSIQYTMHCYTWPKVFGESPENKSHRTWLHWGPAYTSRKWRSSAWKLIAYPLRCCQHFDLKQPRGFNELLGEGNSWNTGAIVFSNLLLFMYVSRWHVLEDVNRNCCSYCLSNWNSSLGGL